MTDEIRNPPKPLIVSNELMSEVQAKGPREGIPVIRSFDGRLWPNPAGWGGWK